MFDRKFNYLFGNTFTNMRFGRRYGMLLTFLSLFPGAFTFYSILIWESYGVKMFFLFVLLFSIGITFLLFPGEKTKYKDFIENYKNQKESWTYSPDSYFFMKSKTRHKVTWVLSFLLIAGAIVFCADRYLGIVLYYNK
ncbi:hypothetical protein FACS1894130_11920 [Spirochaetia bacterium]|nr:hypothetical protein FACS1894130_11920 [Spirochaetia bacterium]